MTSTATKTGNRRVDSLLDCARKHGLAVEPSEHAARCWTIRGDNGRSLTVYGESNHRAVVMGDLPGERDWIEVTQRHAKILMATGALLLASTRRSRIQATVDVESFDDLPIARFDDLAIGDQLRVRDAPRPYIVTAAPRLDQGAITVSVSYDGAPCLMDRYRFAQGEIRIVGAPSDQV